MTQTSACAHVPRETAAPLAQVCQECGSDNRLRLCATCGHVGCCESQRGDARAHALGEKHPVIRSLPLGGRSFTWCYDCNDYVEGEH